ncbi:hypothetical protein RI129_012598 [Pyrocoelia pectoralis]|uniref:Uncharacterized protein n=1 Tax=Pyrocoelia pectoralis TaxID=417401 RepID=A0AAN7ZG65_9COLE
MKSEARCFVRSFKLAIWNSEHSIINMGKFGFNPTKLIHWNTANKYKTEEKKRTIDVVVETRQKYSTAPILLKEKYHQRNEFFTCTICNWSNKPANSQHDYIKQHLYIKCCVDKEKAPWKFQAQKISFRNYTPKTINQEMNMGMWM